MKTFRKLFVCLFLISCLLTALTACGESDGKKLVLTADKTVALRGDTVTLTAAYTDATEPATDATYEIVSGETAATLNGNVLTVSATAATGTVIKVQATAGKVTSNTLEITVSVPVTAITASANGVTNVVAGGNVILAKTVTPADADASAFTWTVTEGANLCTLSGDALLVSASATTGSIIKVKGVCGSVESDELTFTVGYPLESLTVTAMASGNVMNGSTTALTVNYEPASATDATYEWVFIEGGDYANIVYNILVVDEEAPIGTTLKFKAVSGNVESNVVTLTVGVPIVSLTASTTAPSILDKGGNYSLKVTAAPANATVTGVTWTVTEGNDYATVTDGILSIKANTPAGTTVKVKAVSGTVMSNELTFTVGIPVESVALALIGSANIDPGQTRQLTVTVNPADATDRADVAWTVTEGGDYATVTAGVLTVKENAPIGTTVKVKATVGGVDSNVITATVGVVLEEITASVVGSANVPNGSTVILTATFTPANATNTNAVWSIVSGAEHATLTNNTLAISADAPFGTVIQVKATVGTLDSNVVTVTVGIPLETLAISTTAPAILDRGNNYPVKLTAEPATASTAGVAWVVTEGKDYVTVVDGILTVSTATPAGTKVTFHAASGTIVSNELTFTVGIPVETATITLIGTDNVDPGQSRQFTATCTPLNATDASVITWAVTEGKDYADVVNGILTVNANAPIGATVKVQATVGGVASNEITLTVGIPVESVTAALIGTANVDPGNNRQLTATVTPANATNANAVAWAVVEGEEYATVTAGILTVKADAPIGATVKVQATVEGKASNVITLTVGTPVTAITITAATASTEIVKGNSVILSASLTPANASSSLLNWIITEGEANAQIVSGNLVILTTATTGATVKVKAVCGSVESNELTFTVAPTQEEINASKFMISLSEDKITLDKNGTSNPVLEAEVIDYNWEAANKDVTYEIVSGSEYLAINQSGLTCTFTAKAHGEATVRVTVNGTNVYEEATVSVIVAPEGLRLPEVFAERTGFTYNFSKTNPDTQEAYTLPFVVGIVGEGACQDVKVNFLHEDGSSDDAVAGYADGKITFYKEGKVTVTVSSNSGSRIEAKVSYSFNINSGYNVHTFTEASSLLQSSKYTGQIVNVVVLEKPDGSATGYEYGYDLVPEAALLPAAQQTPALVSNSYKNRIMAVNKSLHLNGNQHKIDASQLRVLTSADIKELEDSGKDWTHHGSLLTAEPWTSDSGAFTDVVGDFYCRIYDVELIGNCPIDFPATNGDVIGCYTTGLNVGQNDYSANYYVDVKNITSSKFRDGMSVKRAVGNSKIENIYAYNCYRNGLSVKASILTIKNIKLGLCGAAAIELCPDGSNTAGFSHTEKQTVTFEGTLDAKANLNNGNTNYFKNYTIPGLGYTIPQAAQGIIASGLYTQNQISHMMNMQTGEVGYIVFVLNLEDANYTQIVYPAYQTGGIIDAADLPTSGVDTTHEYVRLPIGLGGMNMGFALLLNLNYAG